MQETQSNKSIILDVKQHVKEYSDVDENSIVVEKMTGITNQTFKVSTKTPGVPSVIYRKFGESDKNIFLDREIEKNVYKHLSEESLGPKVFCYIGDHIRIEKFIDCRILESKDMLSQQAIQNVAFALQQFHSMKQPSNLQKKSFFKQVFFQRKQELLKICKDKMNQNIYNQRQKKLIQLFKSWISAEEIQFLEKAVEPLEDQPLVFSHNDLLANNIIIKNSNNKYVFIDYEYSRYNYTIYDIANYFNESQFGYDVKEEPYFERTKVPENIDSLRRKFVQCYCLALGRKYEDYVEVLKNQEKKADVQDRVERLLKQFHLGAMLSDIMWGFWAVIVCKNPNINFNYLEFCKVRYDNYHIIKDSGLWKL